MAHVTCLFTAIVLGLVLANRQGVDLSPAAPKVATLMKNKLEAARATFKEVWTGPWDHVEVPYQWSYRWLQVERELSDKTADRIAALQAHLMRVREIEQVTKSRYRQRLITIDQVRAAEFYVAEAEVWLSQAKE
jgi:hypothetical protein